MCVQNWVPEASKWRQLCPAKDAPLDDDDDDDRLPNGQNSLPTKLEIAEGGHIEHS